jgi:hypothetical protein
MEYKWMRRMLVAAIALTLVACRSNSNDVPSLDTERPATPTAVVEEEPLDDEAKMMAFTECMREQGIELVDAGVDSEGNVQRPTLAEDVQVSREKFAEARQVCDVHLKGLTLGRERPDRSEKVDQGVALATCLRDKGYDVDDPTAETLDQWGMDFRVEYDWDDPKAMAAYKECSSAD